MADISEADWQDIINTLIAEANGEGPEGMRRVGETILNRSAIRGISPADVVRQPYQYTGFSNPGPAAIVAQRDPASINAAEAAWELAQQFGDPTNGADHYHADYVSPYWANSMPSTGTYGRHQYYSSQPVPVEALAALLTPSTREMAFPRARPETRQVDLPRARPQSPGDLMASMFGTGFSAPQDAATSAGLNDFLTRQTAAGGNLTMPGQIDRSVGALNQKSGLAEALAAMVAPRSTPAMPTGVKQSYAAQDGATSRSAITAASARQAADQLMLRNANQQAADAERNRTVVATIPTSGIGQPPATRVVQSVPVSTSAPKAATTAQRSTPLTVGAASSFAGQDRAVPRKIDSVDTMPAYGDLAMMFDTTPKASGSVNNKKDNERLAPGGAWTASENERLAMHGLEPPAEVAIPNSTAQVQLPRRRPDTTQKTQVAITTPRKVAPTPATRQPQGLTPPVIQPRQQTAAARPLRVTVDGGNYRAPAPVTASTRINQLRAQGLTAAAAYEALNAAARGAPSLEDRITGRGTQASSGASAFSLVG